ncbi:flagellar hook capping protein [Caminibacter mediatlanticus TB-2]|uniref:Basal-body rod modification protein FlgD n=1 Tax=Caminibacter mediatlanticus TB-2 TaxID=391592 RepID=A0AAI9AG27_9BACT|nr:flagellar hook capping FlgD N-terminal domain-containing protein [Caminibacter mediatlanticus]EDM23018.1 Flagellar hook capping protein [Caminibacter mediatlanticus TB-2]QCT94139.1 flagellar hook capping protein [Caminibacter mediatlanticus TB-2]
MAVTTINNNVTTSGNDFVYNPNSQLDKDAFMQLFLKQLEMQDPTDPMDTDKMLEQTAYLSTMEMNQNMQTTLDNLANTLQQTSSLNSISAIGKIGDTGERYINVTDNDTSKNFELYFGDDISSGKVLIKDKNGNIIREFPLEAHTKGILNFDWDLTDNNGQRVPSDTYEITAEYTSPDGKSHSTALGAYPIESIRFENGKAYAKIGSNYVPFDAIKEIYEWQG